MPEFPIRGVCRCWYILPYIRYGNEATLDYAYGDVCLVAHILSKARIQKH